MVNSEILYAKFEQIQKDRPWALRTTLWYGPMGWVLRITGFLIFLLGLFTFASGIFNYTIFNSLEEALKKKNETDVTDIVFTTQKIVGFIILLFGFFMNFSGRLCRRIVQRNLYIMDLEELFDEKTENKTTL